MSRTVDYPTLAEEGRILDAMAQTSPKLEVRPVVSLEDIQVLRAGVEKSRQGYVG